MGDRRSPLCSNLRSVWSNLFFPVLFAGNLLIEKLAPVARDFFLQLPARAAYFGKFFLPLVGPRGVDHGARAVADLIARDARVERAAPSAPENFDRLRGIGAAAKRPQEFF